MFEIIYSNVQVNIAFELMTSSRSLIIPTSKFYHQRFPLNISGKDAIDSGVLGSVMAAQAAKSNDLGKIQCHLDVVRR